VAGEPLVFFRGAYHAIANNTACGLSGGNNQSENRL
jgi:hypothetical protein